MASCRRPAYPCRWATTANSPSELTARTRNSIAVPFVKPVSCVNGTVVVDILRSGPRGARVLVLEI